MVKFSHSIFALPFALMATFMAAREAFRAGQTAHLYPALWQVALVVACMVCARSAAMTFNRLVDAAIDARNPRTARRAIAAGTMSRGEALLYLLTFSGGFVASAAGFWWLGRNAWPVMLSVPVLAYLCFYSYTKRFTRYSHFVLGSAIALSPGAAWLAIHPGSAGRPAVTLIAAVACWIAGFDIIYACQDIEADRREGLHSLPSRIGPARALWIARACHVATVALLAALKPIAGLGSLYAVGVIVVAVLLLVENLLVRADDFSRINLAFFTINGVISLALAGLTIADVMMG